MKNEVIKIIGRFALIAGICTGLCACDSERANILHNIISSPTATATLILETATPTRVPTETPTPTPTVVPIPRVELLLYGDYEMADKEIADQEQKAEDDIAILQTEVERLELLSLSEQNDACIQKLQEMDEKYVQPSEQTRSLLAKAYYIGAECSHKQGDSTLEIEYLGKYTQLRKNPPILPVIYQRIAYAYLNLGDTELFRRNIDYARAHSQEETTDAVKLDYTISYFTDQNLDEAEKRFTELLTLSTDEDIRAACDYYLGLIYESKGMTDKTVAFFQNAVNNYPKSYSSYACLLWLLDNSQIVSDYQRGLINYYRGQYALANAAFRRYIKAEPGHDGSSWYFIGVCEMYMAEYEDSAAAFRKLVDNYPENKYYVSAWDELAYVQWFYLNKNQQAAQTLTGYVKLHPDQSDSAAFLLEAGNILERGNYLSEAAKVWSRLIDEYPLYEQSKSALFKAAIAYFRVGDYESALAALNRLLIVSGVPEDQSQAYFWIAKIYEKKGDAYNRKKYFEKAAEQSKTGYYALRAQEILDGKDYMEPSIQYSFAVDFDNERPVAEQWMLLTFDLEADALNDTSFYAQMPDYLTGNEYYDLGQYQLAVQSFENIREALSGQPAAAYSFMNEMLEKKLYSVAALTSRQILNDAGLHEDDRTLEVPNYFNHVRFGPWFSSYVEQAAAQHDIPPILLYAVMKQESMYNPWVVSSAGARGLMQIMPETGSEIARTLHWPKDYTVSDLNRAVVAIPFGASYLSRFYRYFDDSAAAMLASYNGGSGNTLKWTALAGNDPDLLYEVIRYPETRNYIHNIYVNYKIYDWLYAKR